MDKLLLWGWKGEECIPYFLDGIDVDNHLDNKVTEHSFKTIFKSSDSIPHIRDYVAELISQCKTKQ